MNRWSIIHPQVQISAIAWAFALLATASAQVNSDMAAGGLPDPDPLTTGLRDAVGWPPTDSEAGHRVVVFPGELLFLMTDTPHDSGYAPWVPPTPGAEIVTPGEAFVSYWHAYGGEVLAVDHESILYRAPTEPGIAFFGRLV
ncbi:MAG: hypothetical protein HRF45_13070 [Fimbriimonadia bacterium]